jgi:transposase
MLPKDFPPWPTVYWWFRRFVRRFLFQTIHDVALMLDVSGSDARRARPAAASSTANRSRLLKRKQEVMTLPRRSSDASDISPSTPTVVC